MYLYSNILGTFVFNQNFRIRETIKVTEKDLDKLMSGELLESEKKLQKRFKNIKNLRFEKDEKALDRVMEVLKESKEGFYKENIKLTKSQIRESVSEDQLIIQASNSLEDLNKSINMHSKRLREWFLLTLPEVEDIVEDHKHFAELAIKKRSELIKKYKIKNSMGAILEKTDMEEIKAQAELVLDLFKAKEKREKYLEKIMRKYCPNLTTVAGYLIGAKLIVLGGSLRDLVTMPASTVQLLGAEKALFRHMITGAKPPRHGIIVNHPLISGKPQDEHGKRARALADKISMAVKVDYFKGKFLGDKLNKELEERFP